MDGTVLHGLALIYVVRDLPGIRTFTIVQESLERTRVSIVPEGAFDDRARTTIREGIKARLGRRCRGGCRRRRIDRGRAVGQASLRKSMVSP